MDILTLISICVIVMVVMAPRETLTKNILKKNTFSDGNSVYATKEQEVFEKEKKDIEEDQEEKNLSEEEFKMKPVRLCITGFGSFNNYPGENPSSTTARHLHGRTLYTIPSPVSITASIDTLSTATLSSSSPAPSRKIEITFVGPVDVTYEKVRQVVIGLHQIDEFDAFVHVGVGRPGGLRVEQRSRRVGYNKPGSDGQLCEILNPESGERGISTWPKEGHKDEIRSEVDCEKLVGWLRSQMGIKHILPSTDAGLYLCEYIYGTSLAQSILNTESGSGGKLAPVLFIHVPDLKTDTNPNAFYTESEVSEILERVCWWVGSTV